MNFNFFRKKKSMETKNENPIPSSQIVENKITDVDYYKPVIRMDLSGFLGVKEKLGKLTQNDFNETAAYVVAGLFLNLEEEKGKLSKNDKDILFKIIEEFYIEVEEQFNISIIKTLFHELTNRENAKDKIDNYFSELRNINKKITDEIKLKADQELKNNNKTKYFINKTYKFVSFERFLNDKKLYFSLKYDTNYNIAIRDDKFWYENSFSASEYIPVDVKDFANELDFFIDFLSKYNKISEKELQIALEEKCVSLIAQNKRLIDSDLSIFSDTLMMIYNGLNDNGIDVEKGKVIRRDMITLILNKYTDVFYIQGKDTYGNPTLIKYDENSGLGFILNIN